MIFAATFSCGNFRVAHFVSLKRIPQCAKIWADTASMSEEITNYCPLGKLHLKQIQSVWYRMSESLCNWKSTIEVEIEIRSTRKTKSQHLWRSSLQISELRLREMSRKRPPLVQDKVVAYGKNQLICWIDWSITNDITLSAKIRQKDTESFRFLHGTKYNRVYLSMYLLEIKIIWWNQNLHLVALNLHLLCM